jgi:hypothetical protein
MVLDPRCLVAVIEFEDVRYVQFLAAPGVLVAEVVSNLNIGDAVALSPVEEDQLRSAGWTEPTPGSKPNWRYEATDIAGVPRVVAMTRDAVYDVLGERDRNAVSVRTWEGHYSTGPNDESVEPTRVHYQRTLRDLARRLDDD